MNNKTLEALERLTMPDDLYKKERERLGLKVGDDYEFLKKEFERLEKYDNILSNTRLTQKGGVIGTYVLRPSKNIPKVLVEGAVYDKLGQLEDVYEEGVKDVQED